MDKQSNKRAAHAANHIGKILFPTFLPSAALFLLICNTALAQSSGRTLRVEGTAMEPILGDGDTILLSEEVEKLLRGDIVIFQYPHDRSKLFISRLIGLPGDLVDMDALANITINGKLIEEPYVLPERNRNARQKWFGHESINENKWRGNPIKLHHYFVMGDNRDASNDSRSWGLVPERNILGKFIRITRRANTPPGKTPHQNLLISENLIEIDSQNFAHEVTDSKIPVLIFIWAQGAVPSWTRIPTVGSIASGYNDRIKVCALNADENKDITTKFRIDNLPTLLLFWKGAEQERLVGTQSKETVLKLVERHLDRSK